MRPSLPFLCCTSMRSSSGPMHSCIASATSSLTVARKDEFWDRLVAARVDGDRPLPPARGRAPARVARQEEHEERPREEDGGGEVYPRRSEKEEPHSTLNAKPPSVTSASIDSTRHLTRYVPGGSAGSVTRSSTGFERSTRLSPRSTCPPRSFTTRTEL